MNRSFGHTINFTFSTSRNWLSLGPGWAALAGALAGGYPEFSISVILQVVALWLLVDPILGTVWALAVNQGLWRHVTRANLPPPPEQGFNLPYVQSNSVGGDFVLLMRRYGRWWAKSFWPEFGGQVVTFGVGVLLALLLSLVFSTTVFWLVILAVGLIILTGFTSAELPAKGGGRLQSVVQFLLPWLMGVFIWTPQSWVSPSWAPVMLGVCYWMVYLGGLRMLGGHHRAGILFFLGQAAAIVIFLAIHIVPAAAVLSVFLFAQLLIKTKYSESAQLLPKVQIYLVLGVLTTGLVLGILG